MAAEINELFEQGITHCGELTDAVDEALDAIDDLTREAAELAERVQDEGSDASRHMRELANRLEQAESDLAAAFGQADGALEGLAGTAAELEEDAGHLVERVKESRETVDVRTEEADTALDAHIATAQQDFRELAEKTDEERAAVERHLQDASQSIAAFRLALDAARADFARKRHAWSEAVTSLETAVGERAEEWVGGLNDLMARQSTALVEAANAMVDHHNAAMEGLKRRFVEQAPIDLGAALDPLEAALGQIAEGATERAQRLAGEAQELEEWVRQSLPALAPVEAALQCAARLE